MKLDIAMSDSDKQGLSIFWRQMEKYFFVCVSNFDIDDVKTLFVSFKLGFMSFVVQKHINFFVKISFF